MNHCPKCGCPRITGPRYHKDVYGHESLTYTCNQCGYSESTVTLDSEKANEIFKKKLLKTK